MIYRSIRINMKTNAVTEGKQFDWSKASSDYAKYRDIYPLTFYQKIQIEDCV